MHRVVSCFLFLAFIFLGPGVLRAEQPIGVGTIYWTHDQALSTSSACVTETGTTSCMLFPAGTSDDHSMKVTVVELTAASACCFVGLSSLDVLASGDPVVTDAGGTFGTGGGSCARLRSAGFEHIQADRALMGGLDDKGFNNDATPGVSGYSRGLCHTPRTRGHESLYRPCRQNSDCTGASGTCDQNPTSAQRAKAGMYMVCEADLGTPRAVFRKQRIKR